MNKKSSLLSIVFFALGTAWRSVRLGNSLGYIEPYSMNLYTIS